MDNPGVAVHRRYELTSIAKCQWYNILTPTYHINYLQMLPNTVTLESSIKKKKVNLTS